jgi:hypothetical protein
VCLVTRASSSACAANHIRPIAIGAYLVVMRPRTIGMIMATAGVDFLENRLWHTARSVSRHGF